MSFAFDWRTPGARGLSVLSCLALGAALASACGSDDTVRKVPGDGGEGGELAAGGSQVDANGGVDGDPVGGTSPGGTPTGGGEAGSGATQGGAPAEGGAKSQGGSGEAGSPGEAGAAGNVATGPLRAYSVFAGFYNSFVVELGTRDVWAWGYQVAGATGGYDTANAAGWATKPVRVQGLTDVEYVVAVSEIAAFYALHTDGTVSAWGLNSVGQLGDHTTTTRPLPVKVQDVDGTVMRGVCSIAAGANVLVMSRAPDCSDYAVGSEPPSTITGIWTVGLFTSTTIGGSNMTGFGFNGSIARQHPGLPAGVKVSGLAMPDAAASAQAGVLVFLANGTRYAWGYNPSNLLGAGTGSAFAGDNNTAVDVSAFWGTAKGADLGRDCSTALAANDTLTGVGRNVEGQLGTGNETSQTTLVPVINLTNVSDFSVGQVTVTAITAGQLWGWGWNGSAPVSTPGRLGALDGFTRVSQGDEHALAIGADSRVYVWGGRSYGALGDGLSSGRSSTPALLVE